MSFPYRLTAACCALLAATLPAAAARDGGLDTSGTGRRPDAGQPGPITNPTEPQPPITGVSRTAASEILVGKLEHARVTRGQRVVVRVTFRQVSTVFNDGTIARVRLNGAGFGNIRAERWDGTSLSFIVPDFVPIGTYSVKYDFPKGESFTAAPLEIASDDAADVLLTGIAPIISYPDDSAGGDGVAYELSIYGDGFSPYGVDNRILEKTHGELRVCWEDDCEAGTLTHCYGSTVKHDACGKYVHRGELYLTHLSNPAFRGTLSLQVKKGDRISQPATVTLSAVKRRWPILISTVLVAILLGMVLLPTMWDRSKQLKPVGLTSLLVEKENNTLSLSYFQIYAWMVVALFGYLYLFVARAFVQGQIGFPDLPGNLPGMLGIATATTAVSIGIRTNRGSKGAGSRSRRLSDFWTTGDVVAPERIQFFLWTLVSLSIFLAIIISSDPGRISDLPKIPDGFLALTGVSALGYLGGKFARKAGPAIPRATHNVEEQTAEDGSKSKCLVVEVEGAGLDRKKGTIKIADKSTDVKAEGNEGEGPDLVNVLVFKVPSAAFEEGATEYLITVVNGDGQTAQAMSVAAAPP